MKKNLVEEVRVAKAIIANGKVWNKGNQFRVYFESENGKCYFDANKNTWNGDAEFAEAIKKEVEAFANEFVEVSEMDVMAWLGAGYEGLNANAFYAVPLMKENKLVYYVSEARNVQRTINVLDSEEARITKKTFEKLGANIDEYPLIKKYMEYSKYVPVTKNMNMFGNDEIIECENDYEEVVDTINVAEIKAEIEKLMSLLEDEEVAEVATVEEVKEVSQEEVEMEKNSLVSVVEAKVEENKKVIAEYITESTKERLVETIREAHPVTIKGVVFRGLEQFEGLDNSEECSIYSKEEKEIGEAVRDFLESKYAEKEYAKALNIVVDGENFNELYDFIKVKVEGIKNKEMSLNDFFEISKKFKHEFMEKSEKLSMWFGFCEYLTPRTFLQKFILEKFYSYGVRGFEEPEEYDPRIYEWFWGM